MSIQTENAKQRSEPIQDIIDRMPSKFGIWITSIVLGLVALLFIFGWLIAYPDTIVGDIAINSKYSAIKLVANTSGKMLLLNIKARNPVKEGQYLAVIQNSANLTDVQRLNRLLATLDVTSPNVFRSFPSFQVSLSLGEINVKYYNFLNALQQLYRYKIKNVFENQEENLKDQIAELTVLLQDNKNLQKTREKNMNLQKKIADRDSILFSQKVSPEEDVDHSKIAFLSSKENYQSVDNEIRSTEQQIDDDQNKLGQLYIQKSDKERQMYLDVISTYDDLKDNIKEWEQHYILKSPMDGKVEFLKFWSTNQFVQSGEEVFTIVPKENKIFGQVELPSQGAGKVKEGQEVIIKLDNYPYEEFGTVIGKVRSISLITNLQKVNQNNVDIYLVDVDLPAGLSTSIGSKLQFKFQIKGTAEIVSADRKLIQRFFDNLKYNTSK